MAFSCRRALSEVPLFEVVTSEGARVALTGRQVSAERLAARLNLVLVEWLQQEPVVAHQPLPWID